MLLHGIHLSSATLHVINLQLYGYRKLYLNLHLKLYLKSFRKLYLKQFPLPTVAIQAPVVPKWRQRLDDVTILYNTVTDKVNGGLSLSQALALVDLSKGMFQRRRDITETYISLPECVKSSLQEANKRFYFAFGHLICNS